MLLPSFSLRGMPGRRAEGYRIGSVPFPPSLGNNVYDAAVAATNEMLEWLGFDAVKAQRRIVVLMGDFTRSVKS